MSALYRISGTDRREYGPATAEQLQAWIAEGRANAQTMIWSEGASDWKPLGSFPEFSLLLLPAAPPPLRHSPYALTGLILSLVSVTFGLCCCYGIPFNVLGLVFSAIGLAQIKQHPEEYSGKGMAVAGIVLAVLSLALAAVMLAMGLALSFGSGRFDFHWR